MSSHPTAETIESLGCSIVLRRVEGPEARELYFHCQPPPETAEAGRQAEAIYHAIFRVLESEGGSFGSVVTETVFLRKLQASVASVRDARHRVLAAHGVAAHRPATTEIELPPLDERACLEVSVQAVVRTGSSFQFEPVAAAAACGCGESAQAHGLRFLFPHAGQPCLLFLFTKD